MNSSKNRTNALYRIYMRMYLIRRTEEVIEDLFSRGTLRGTTHGCRGQEAIPAAILDHIDLDNDYVTGNHRSHGDYLALTEDPFGLIAELKGLPEGIVQGKGGSQHIRYKNFYTNGITGGMVPVAAGLAFRQLKLSKDGIVVAFFGDGAMNEGHVLESLNLAAVFDVPVLLVLQNNHYAMSTPVELVTREPLKSRAEAFGLEAYAIDALDPGELWDISGSIIGHMRQDRKPRFMEIKTFRFSGHSKSDKREYIPAEEDEYWHRNDPLKRLASQILENEREMIELKVGLMIEDALKRTDRR